MEIFVKDGGASTASLDAVGGWSPACEPRHADGNWFRPYGGDLEVTFSQITDSVRGPDALSSRCNSLRSLDACGVALILRALAEELLG
jgi:hypothetical protein